MKNYALVFLAILFLPTTVYASEITGQFSEVTPDSPYYSFDRFIDSVRLFFVSSDDEIDVQIDIAKERLDEALIMEEHGKIDELTVLLQEYMDHLTVISEKLIEQNELDRYDDKLKELVFLSDDLELYVEEDVKSEMIRTKEIVYLASSVIPSEQHSEILQIKDDYAMDMEEVLYLVKLCDLTGYSLRDMVAFIQDSGGIKELYQRFDYTLADGIEDAYKSKTDHIYSLLEEASNNGDEELVGELESDIMAVHYRMSKKVIDEQYLAELNSFNNKYEDKLYFMTSREEREYRSELREIHESYTRKYKELYVE